MSSMARTCIMLLAIFSIFCCFTFGYAAGERGKYYITYDDTYPNLVLTGYFDIRKRGLTSQCGKIDQHSIYLAFAMVSAVHTINSKENILFGLKLGFRCIETCGRLGNLRNNIRHVIGKNASVGVIGPGTSDEAILATPTFGIFGAPLISYSASSTELNDRERYFNLYRTIPSDDLKNRAMVDIIKQFNWTYISTVISHGNYEQRRMRDLMVMLKQAGICIAKSYMLPRSANITHFQAAVKDLNTDLRANVVVLLTTEEDTIRLIKTSKSGRKFTWLLSSILSRNKDTLKDIKDEAKGSMMLSYKGISNTLYRKRFLSMKKSMMSSTWLREFWEESFNCSFKKNTHKKFCTGNKDLDKSNFLFKYTAANTVIDAVNKYVCTIRNIIKDLCKTPGKQRIICAKKKRSTIRRYTVENYLRMGLSTCEPDIKINAVRFDSEGTLYRDIEIVNFNGEVYRTVGIWKLNSTNNKGLLKVDHSQITWIHGKKASPLSSCSLPCKPGEISIEGKTRSCCHTCKPCAQNAYTLNNTCKQCKTTEVPNKLRTSCKKLPVKILNIKHPMSQITTAGSVLGLLLNAVVIILFIKHRKSQIVKASGRELSFVILAGLNFCFLSPLVFYLKPSKILCGLRRFIFGITLTICYTPLMLKIIRIYRIFRAAQRMISLPQFVSPKSQIFICIILLGIQILLCIMWVVSERPSVSYIIHKDTVAEVCKTNVLTIVINLIPCFALITISTIVAFKTRKFPKNYNEAYSIGITMYINCFLWALFIPVMLWVKLQSNEPFAQMFVVLNFNNVIGLVSLVCLFGPKVRRILFRRQFDGSHVYFSSGLKENSINNSVDISLGSMESIIATLDDEKAQKIKVSDVGDKKNKRAFKTRIRRKTF